MTETFEDSTQADRVGLILQSVDTLPTISSVAVRILELAGSSDADVDEIIGLISSDPALTAKLLAMCKRADRGVQVQTIERAVVMLGLDTVRAAVLSLEVFGAIEGHERNEHRREQDDEDSRFERRHLWRYLIATACAAELLSDRHQVVRQVLREEAFVGGLLHGLGMLALDRVLPRSFARAAYLAEQQQTDLGIVARKIIGLDHHTAGKRLAEHWKLPVSLSDVMWLCGQPPATLPDLPHRPLVALVTVAAEFARQQHIGWSGRFTPPDALESLAQDAGLSPEGLSKTASKLHERVAERVAILGLDEVEDRQLLLESVVTANGRLGRLTELLHDEQRRTESQRTALKSISSFFSQPEPARSVSEAASQVARSACSVMNAAGCAFVLQLRSGSPWQVLQFGDDGEALTAPQTIDLGEGDEVTIADLAAPSMKNAAVLTRVCSTLHERVSPEQVQVTLMLDGGQSCAMLAPGTPAEALGNERAGGALVRSWASAIRAAAHQQGVRALSEQLASSTRKISEMHAELVEARAMARLGELASGAAHEMNNPLTVISGKAQLLLSRARQGEAKQALGDIVDATGDLRCLIDALHFFAAPPKPTREDTLLETLVREAYDEAREAAGFGSVAYSDHTPAEADTLKVPFTFETDIADGVSMVRVDPAEVRLALTELITNAIEARPASLVRVTAQPDTRSDRLLIEVTDDGVGFSDRARQHACDPFFSEKPAGRQTGLGLAKVARVAETHGGRVDIASAPGQTRVSLSLADWRAAGETPGARAA